MYKKNSVQFPKVDESSIIFLFEQIIFFERIIMFSVCYDRTIVKILFLSLNIRLVDLRYYCRCGCMFMTRLDHCIEHVYSIDICGCLLTYPGRQVPEPFMETLTGGVDLFIALGTLGTESRNKSSSQ